MLYFDEFDDISKKVYKDNKCLRSYEKDKKKLTTILKEDNISFYTEGKAIKNLNWFGRLVCSRVDNILELEGFDKNKTILELKDLIRSEVAFKFNPEKIDFLIEVLNRIPDLESWSSSILEGIYRDKIRKKDSNSNPEISNLFSTEEKKKLLSVADWIRFNIRKFHKIEADKIETIIDWGSVLKEIERKGYKDLSDKFIEKSIQNRDYEKYIGKLYNLLLDLDTKGELEFWNLKTIKDNSVALDAFFYRHYKDEETRTYHKNILGSLAKMGKKGEYFISKFKYKGRKAG